MSVPSGGFSGNTAQTLGPSAPAPAAAPSQVPGGQPRGQQSHLHLVQPSHHQAAPQHQAGDFRSLYETSQKELEDLKGKYGETSRTLDVLRKKTDGQGQMLDKLRQVFVPEAAPNYQAPNPVDEKVAKLEQALDFYIQKGFEAEKEGNPIPLTIDNAIRQITGQIELLKETSGLKDTVAKLQKQLEASNNPDHQLNGQAYQHIDGFLARALDTLYGPGDEHLPAKNAQWVAGIQQIKAEVLNLQKNHPDVWDRARRDPQKLQRLVNHVVTQSMPPKARQIIETERLRNEPMTEGQLWKAYGEAKQEQDPRKRNQLMTAVRREILAFKFNKNAGRGATRRF